MRGSWAKFAQLGFTLALLLIISDAARVSGGPASDDAAAPVPVATPTPELTATPTVTPTSTAGPTARPRATPPPDPRPIGAIDEDPPVRTTDEWVPVARPRLEPEVAGLTVTAPSSPTPAPTPAVATPTPTSTVAPAPIATATPTATAAPVVSAALPPPTPTPTPAPSPVPTAPPNSASTQGQQALDLIAYPWEASLPGWTIDFLDERSGLRGLTFTGEHRIEVYVRPGDSTWDIARVVAHEIGHAVDLMHNTTTERASWLEHRGIPDAAWWPGSAASDFESGAGDFAECFATWQVGSGSLAIGGGCDQSDIDLVAALS